MKSKQCLLIAVLIISPFACAHADDFEMMRLKAQDFIVAKDWSAAEHEAKAMTKADPANPDGWLMYGIVEQRLEKNESAANAYKKYLDLHPPSDKAEAVRQRLAQVEVRAERARQKETTKKQQRYGLRSNGVYFAFAPIYEPSTSTVLSGNVNSNYQLGLQLQQINLGVMYDGGSVSQLRVPAGGSSYKTAGPANLATWTFYAEYNYILTNPFTTTGPFSIYIPAHLGFFTNTLRLSDGSNSYSNMGAEVGTGIGVQWYSRTPLAIGMAALYHQGVGFENLTSSTNTSQGVENMSGVLAHGGNVGPEIRLIFTYLFGYEKSLAEKAGAL